MIRLLGYLNLVPHNALHALVIRYLLDSNSGHLLAL